MSKEKKKKTKQTEYLETEKPKKPGKQLPLIFFSVLVLFVFFSLETNAWWYKNRIKRYYQEIPKQFKQIDNTEFRLTERHNYNYQVVSWIKKQTNDSSVILLPPKKYITENFSKDFFQWGVAAYTYYFTGRKCSNYMDSVSYTHAVVINNKKLSLLPMKSKEMVKQIMEVYNK